VSGPTFRTPLQEEIRRARACAVPLVGVTTADQLAAEEEIRAGLNGSTPVILWNSAAGLAPGNDPGASALAAAVGDTDPAEVTRPADALRAALALPDGSALVCRGAQRIGTDPAAVQAAANLRGAFAATGRTLILIGTGDPWPAELAGDIHPVDHALPTDAQRQQLAAETCRAAGVDLAPAELQIATDATRGLPAFAAEQAIALSVSPQGLDAESLWRRWRTAIDATPGLRVYPAGEGFRAVGGLQGFRDWAAALQGGTERPDAVVFLDEIEKAIAGASGGARDSSGVSTEILGSILTHMQETSTDGAIAIGPPGSGKSLSAAALGAELGIPTIALDLGSLKGSLVGESERNTRDALRTIRSLAPRTIWIATCNSIGALPPELRRRFNWGVWFFDLPTAEERAAIWTLQLARYALPADAPRPVDDGWTGAEIQTACRMAARLRRTPLDVAGWIVPVSRSAPEMVDGLRRSAVGRYISATTGRPYELPAGTAIAPVASPRRFGMEG
jgi:hypothetical protein